MEQRTDATAVIRTIVARAQKRTCSCERNGVDRNPLRLDYCIAPPQCQEGRGERFGEGRPWHADPQRHGHLHRRHAGRCLRHRSALRDGPGRCRGRIGCPQAALCESSRSALRWARSTSRREAPARWRRTTPWGIAAGCNHRWPMVPVDSLLHSRWILFQAAALRTLPEMIGRHDTNVL